MFTLDPRSLNLADFYPGHDTDPLAAAPEFTAWMRATARERAALQRPLAGAAGPRTRLEVNGDVREVINLASLDYLGLNRHPAVARAIVEAIAEWGVGACGVPLLTGTAQSHKALERATSALLERDETLLFPSGFAGGDGLMSALLRRGDVAIADEKAHICWMDGIRTSGATLATFPHGDVQALDALLSRHADRRRVVIVDGLYSMDGDVADLPALLDVCDAHRVGLIVDEAHSIFALGSRGGGVTDAQGENARVRLLFGTYSKALGMMGGFVAGGEEVLSYARLYAHPFGFSAAMPPAYAVGVAKAVEIASAARDRRERLAANAAYVREAFQTMGLNTGVSTTHVIPIIVNDRGFLYDAALRLIDRGVYAVPVDYPAVPEDAVRFRIALSSEHTRADLHTALAVIEDTVARPLRQR